MKLSDLIKPGEYEKCEIPAESCIEYVSSSPEECSGRCLFLLENPLKMPDISKFKETPLAIVTEDDAIQNRDIPIITVKNARLSSSLIHCRFRSIDFNEIKVIGITGTNGKTTTALMIYSTLLDNNIKAGFIGTGRIEICGERINSKDYSMTTPDPSMLYKLIKKMQDEGCRFVVMEVSSHSLKLDKVGAIPFEYGVFTNLTPEHTDFHKDINDYFSSKMKLISTAKKRIVNIDDYYGREIEKVLKEHMTSVGVLWRGDFYATNVEQIGMEALSYYLHSDKLCYKTTLHFPGKYNIYNSLLASAVCIEIGIAPCLVKKSLSNFKGVEGRFEVIKDKITVIIDYAHTEAAYLSFLSSVQYAAQGKNLTVVFGCGGSRDRNKRPKIAAAVEKYATKIIVTEDNSREEAKEQIFNDITAGFSKDFYKIIPDRRDAIREAITNSEPGDVVAVIGKGAEEYNIDQRGYHSFSDKAIIYEVLKSNAN